MSNSLMTTSRNAKRLMDLTRERHKETTINKEGYRQKNQYSCGYFTAKAIINSLGNKCDKNLVKALKLTKDGVRQNNLIRTLRDRGVSASVYYDLTPPKIKKFLSKGKYIIVYNHSIDHWLVLGWMSGVLCWFYDPEDKWSVEYYTDVEEDLNGFGIVCGKNERNRT